MMKNNRRIAEDLLQIKAIKLEPASPFTWASGWHSPIYCDNRKTLSYPEIRTFIRDQFTAETRLHFADLTLVAGVATGGIAQGALVAEQLNMPFVYVRSSAKGHGLENLVEGHLEPGMKTVVIEDLVSTGGSSLKAVKALRAAGCEVLGLIAIFTYGFSEAVKNFENAKVPLITLCDYTTLIEQAVESGYVQEAEMEILHAWRKDPSNWRV